MSLIEFRNAGKSYGAGGREVAVLRPLSLSVARGEVFGIVGHSGAGKSTLLRMINRLESASAGQVQVDGQDIAVLDAAGLRALRRRIGMIFQHFNLLASRTVAGNVALPLELAGKPAGRIRTRVDELLERVGLADRAGQYPAQLSGGQKQRVGIARALATAPDILLCDEATSALDPQTTASVLRLLARLNRELGLTIVLITHEMDVVRRVCDRVAVLDAGELGESGAVAEVFLHPRHPTTRRFVSETEHLDGRAASADFAGVPGRLVCLTFTGANTWRPLLGEVAAATGVACNILAGRIDRIRELPYGQLTVALSGGDADAALAALADAGVHVRELRA